MGTDRRLGIWHARSVGTPRGRIEVDEYWDVEREKDQSSVSLGKVGTVSNGRGKHIKQQSAPRELKLPGRSYLCITGLSFNAMFLLEELKMTSVAPPI